MRGELAHEGLGLVVHAGELTFQPFQSQIRIMSINHERSEGEGRGNVLRPSVMQVDIVVDVQVRAPMTDLGHTLQFLDLQDGEIIAIMNRQRFLVRLDELRADRLWDVAERPIGDGRAGLGRDAIGREAVDAFRGGIRENVGAR